MKKEQMKRRALRELLAGNSIIYKQHRVLIQNISMRFFLQKKGLWKEYCMDDAHAKEMNLIITEANKILIQLDDPDNPDEEDNNDG